MSEPDYESLCVQAAMRQQIERAPAEDRLSELAEKFNLSLVEITGEPTTEVEKDEDEGEPDQEVLS